MTFKKGDKPEVKRWVKYDGKEYTIVEFTADFLNCKTSTVYRQLRKGLSIKEIIDKYERRETTNNNE